MGALQSNILNPKTCITFAHIFFSKTLSRWGVYADRHTTEPVKNSALRCAITHTPLFETKAGAQSAEGESKQDAGQSTYHKTPNAHFTVAHMHLEFISYIHTHLDNPPICSMF